MRKAYSFGVFVMLCLGVFSLAACGGGSDGDTVKIGLNLELTGSIPKVGELSLIHISEPTRPY